MGDLNVGFSPRFFCYNHIGYIVYDSYYEMSLVNKNVETGKLEWIYKMIAIDHAHDVLNYLLNEKGVVEYDSNEAYIDSFLKNIFDFCQERGFGVIELQKIVPKQYQDRFSVLATNLIKEIKERN